MGDLDKIITYTFQMRDNVSSTADNMGASATRAQTSIDALSTSEKQLRTETAETTASIQAQQVTVMAQLTALMGLRSSVSAVTGGMKALGLVSDESAEALAKVNGAFALFSGAVTAIKSVQAVMTTLNASSALYATIQTYLQGLKNPLLLGGALVGMGAAGAIGGYFLSQNNNTTNNSTTVNVQGVSQTATATIQQEVYQMGALK